MADNDEPKKSLSQQRFGERAQAYVTSAPHAQGDDLERLVDIAQPQPDWAVLDVATGGGHTALRFAPHVAQVVATDLTPEMLEAAQAHLTSRRARNVTFRLADAEELPFEAATFDLVTCRIAPHHFADPARFVREGARVLKPGGLLLVQDHLIPDDQEAAHHIEAFEKLRDPSHNRAFTRGEWSAMFEAAGLAVEHVEEAVKELDFSSWTERQGCTPEVIQKLSAMLQEIPVSLAEWMRPQGIGTPAATFASHHILISGRKGT